MRKNWMLVLLAFFYSATLFAQEQTDVNENNGLILNLPHYQFLQLAAADTGQAAESTMMEHGSDATAEGYKDRWITGNKVHKYLGIASIGFAIAAGLAPKEEDGIHHDFARAAFGFGVGAVATGFLFHYEDLSLKNGLSNPDNMHAVLTSLGVLGYGIAVDKAPEEGHAGAGLGGAALMLVGIKMTW